MSDPHVTGVVLSSDVMAAQNVLDSWTAGPRLGPQGLLERDLLNLRGLIAAAYADVRTAGYLEGVQEGRRETAAIVRNALEGEGL
jgi:hypothetical protein